MQKAIAVFKCNMLLPKRDMDAFKKEIQEGIDKGWLLLPPELELQLIMIDDAKVDVISADEFIKKFVEE